MRDAVDIWLKFIKFLLTYLILKLVFHLRIISYEATFLFDYSKVIKFKLLCETLKNEKWKILAWYPNKMQRYRQLNPNCDDWRWANFQMQVALQMGFASFFMGFWNS